MTKNILKGLALSLALTLTCTRAWAEATADENGLTPITWYKFDQAMTFYGSGTDIFSGCSENGSASDFVASNADGSDTAMVFNHTSSTKAHPYTGSDQARNTAMSWVARAKTKAMNNGIIWCKGKNNTQYGYALVATQAGVAVHTFGTASSGWNISSGTNLIEAAVENATMQYHNYVVTYEGSESADGTNIVKLYVDGELKGTATAYFYGLSDQSFQVGNMYANINGEGMVVGEGIALDDYRRYDVTLTDAQVAAIHAANPLYPTLTVYTYDCDSKTWSPSEPTTISSLTALKYIGTGTIALPTGWQSAAAVEIADTITVTGVELTDVASISGSPTFKYGDDSQTAYAPTAVAKYEFTNAKITNEGSASSTIVVKDGDEVTIARSGQNDGRTRYSLDVSGGELTIEGQNGENASIWYGADGGIATISGGMVTAKATGTGTSGTGNGFLLGWSGSGATLNISGGSFLIENSSLNFWVGTANVSGGTLKVKGVFNGSSGNGVIVSGGTFELGSIGYKDAPLTLNGGTLKAYESTTISSAITLGGNPTVEVVEDATLTLTGSITGDYYLTKTGEGTLDIGSQRPTLDVAEGDIAMIATADEVVAGKIELTVPTGASPASKDKITVRDLSGNELEIDNIAISDTTLTITLKQDMPTITASSSVKNIAGLEFPTAGGVLVIQGAEDAVNAYTVTFDAALPTNVTVLITGYVNFKLGGSETEFPLSVMTFNAGAVVSLDTGDAFTVPPGVTIFSTASSGSITNNGTLFLSSGEFTIVNTGTLNITNGTVTVKTSGQTLAGTVNIAKGATLVSGNNDMVPYGSSGYIINVWGTLNMASTRWTLRGTLNLYGGCTLTGDGDKDGFMDLYNGGTLNVLEGDGTTELTLSTMIRVRNGTEVINVATNMTLYAGVIGTSEAAVLNKTGPGKLVVSGNQTYATLNINAGTFEINTGDASNTITVNTAISGTPVISGTGTVNLAGATLAMGATYGMTNKFVASSGTSTISFSKENTKVCSNDSKDSPWLTINSGATMNLNAKDFSGWSTSLDEHTWIVNAGTLNLGNNGGSFFFNDHLVLSNGSTVNLVNTGRQIALYGGAATEATAQIQLASGTATIAGTEDSTGMCLGNDGSGSYGTTGAGITVGDGATLTISARVNGSDGITKYGEGTLVLSCSTNTYSGTVTIDLGTIKSATELTVIYTTGRVSEEYTENISGVKYYVYTANARGPSDIYFQGGDLTKSSIFLLEDETETKWMAGDTIVFTNDLKVYVSKTDFASETNMLFRVAEGIKVMFGHDNNGTNPNLPAGSTITLEDNAQALFCYWDNGNNGATSYLDNLTLNGANATWGIGSTNDLTMVVNGTVNGTATLVIDPGEVIKVATDAAINTPISGLYSDDTHQEGYSHVYTGIEGGIAEYGGTKYTTVQKAINAVSGTEATITILADCDTETITIPSRVTISFELADGVSYLPTISDTSAGTAVIINHAFNVQKLRDFSTFYPDYTFGTGVTIYAAETAEEFGKASDLVFTNVGSGITTITVQRHDGSYQDVSISGGAGTLSKSGESAKINESATIFDVSYDITTTGFVYKCYSGAALQYDTTPATFATNESGVATGVYVKHHPYISGAASIIGALNNWSVAVVGLLPATTNTIFIHVGHTDNNGIYIASGADANKVDIGTNAGGTYTALTSASVANSARKNHAYVLTKSGTTLRIYLDGTLISTTTVDDNFKLGSTSGAGLQVGSPYGGNAGKYSKASDDTATVTVIRMYDYELSSAQITALSEAYPYTSDATTFTRTVSASGNLAAADTWSREGDSSTYALPEEIDGVTPNAEIIVTADATLTINTNLTVDAFTITNAGTSAKLTIAYDGVKAHQLIPQSGVTIATPTTIKWGSADIHLVPLTVVGDGSLTVDLVGIDGDIEDIYTAQTFGLTGTTDYQSLTCLNVPETNIVDGTITVGKFGSPVYANKTWTITYSPSHAKGDTIYWTNGGTWDSAKFANAAGETCVRFDGDIIAVTNAVEYTMDADALNGITLRPAGEAQLVFTSATYANTFTDSLTNSTWAGTVKFTGLTNDATTQNFNPVNYGNAQSTIAFENCKISYFPNGTFAVPATLKLIDDAAHNPAIAVNDGFGAGIMLFAKVTGDGAWNDASSVAQRFVFQNAKDWTGNITVKSNRIIFSETANNYVPGGIYVGGDAEVTITANTIWTAASGVQIADGATLNIQGQGTITGAVTVASGAVVKVNVASSLLVDNQNLLTWTSANISGSFDIGSFSSDWVAVPSDTALVLHALQSSSSISALNSSGATAVYLKDGATLSVNAAVAADSINVYSAGSINLTGTAANAAKLNFDNVQGGVTRSWLTAPSIIGFNFNAAGARSGVRDGLNANDVSGALESCSNWYYDTTNATGSAAIFSDGLSTLTWGSANVYSTAADVEGTFMDGYLDDASGVTITLSALPYDTYDIIIYCATDSSGVQFDVKEVNGQYYYYDSNTMSAAVTNITIAAWGTSGVPSGTAVMGSNAIRINGLAGKLTIRDSFRAQGARRGCIAAIQVMEHNYSSQSKFIVPSSVSAVNWSDTAYWSGGTMATGGPVVIETHGDVTITLNRNISLGAVTLTGSGTVKFVRSAGISASVASIARDASSTQSLVVEDYTSPAVAGAVMMPITYSGKITTEIHSGLYGVTYTGETSDSSGMHSVTNNFVGGTMTLDGVNFQIQGGTAFSGTQTTVNIINGARVEYDDMFAVGMAIYNISNNAYITSERFITSNGASGRTAIVNLNDDAIINITGSANVDGNTTSIMLGHWNGSSTLTIQDNAIFAATNAQVLVGKTGNTQTINLNGGSLVTKGIVASASASGANTINLNGGNLTLGSAGLGHYGSTKLTVNVNSDFTLSTLSGTIAPIYEAIDGAGTITVPSGSQLAFASFTNIAAEVKFDFADGAKLIIIDNEAGAVTINTNQFHYSAVEVWNDQLTQQIVEKQVTYNDDGTWTYTWTPNPTALYDYTFNESYYDRRAADRTAGTITDRVIPNYGTAGGSITVDTGYVADGDDSDTSNKVAVNPETYCLRARSTPYGSMSYPTTFTLMVYSEMPQNENDVLMSFGGPNAGFLALIRGSTENEVKLVWAKSGQRYTTLSTMKVKSATATKHLYMVVRTGTGSDDTLNVYLDGELMIQVSDAGGYALGAYVQLGSVYNGIEDIYGLNRIGSDDSAEIGMFRLYEGNLAERSEVLKAIISEFPAEKLNLYSWRVLDGSVALTNKWYEAGAKTWLVSTNAFFDADATLAELPLENSDVMIVTTNATEQIQLQMVFNSDNEQTNVFAVGDVTIVGESPLAIRHSLRGNYVDVGGTFSNDVALVLDSEAFDVKSSPVRLGEQATLKFDFTEYANTLTERGSYVVTGVSEYYTDAAGDMRVTGEVAYMPPHMKFQGLLFVESDSRYYIHVNYDREVGTMTYRPTAAECEFNTNSPVYTASGEISNYLLSGDTLVIDDMNTQYPNAVVSFVDPDLKMTSLVIPNNITAVFTNAVSGIAFASNGTLRVTKEPSSSSLTDKEVWQGTLEMIGINFGGNKLLNYGNASSTLRLVGCTLAYTSNVGYRFAGNLQIEAGDNSEGLIIKESSGNNQTFYIATLTGTGLLGYGGTNYVANADSWVIVDASAFAGSISNAAVAVNGNYGINTIIGSKGSLTAEPGKSVITVAEDGVLGVGGTIYAADGITVAGTLKMAAEQVKILSDITFTSGSTLQYMAAEGGGTAFPTCYGDASGTVQLDLSAVTIENDLVLLQAAPTVDISQLKFTNVPSGYSVLQRNFANGTKGYVLRKRGFYLRIK